MPSLKNLDTDRVVQIAKEALEELCRRLLTNNRKVEETTTCNVNAWNDHDELKDKYDRLNERHEDVQLELNFLKTENKRLTSELNLFKELKL